MPMRWRWPPENSCGKRLTCSGFSPTRVEQLARRAARRRAPTPRSRSGTPTICPTRLRGFSEACGSWKTICSSRRTGAQLAPPGVRDVRAAEADRAAGRRRRAASSARTASTCRSPTRRRCRASRPPASVNETSSTACTSPDRAVEQHARARPGSAPAGARPRAAASGRATRHAITVPRRRGRSAPSTSRALALLLDRQPAAVAMAGASDARLERRHLAALVERVRAARPEVAALRRVQQRRRRARDRRQPRRSGRGRRARSSRAAPTCTGAAGRRRARRACPARRSARRT